jgi:tRNA-dihydrouridine synthase
MNGGYMVSKDDDEYDKGIALFKRFGIDRGVKKETKKTKQTKGNVMKGRSDITVKDGKRNITTELNIKKGLTPKEKSTLKKSIIDEFDVKIKGSGMKPEIILSSDSEDEKRPKRGGKLKPVNTLKDILKHLLEHIQDMNGEYDEDDYKHSKEIIDILKGVKKSKKKKGTQSSLSQYLNNVEKKKDDERLMKVDKFLNMF